jgi:hypothetical protein
MTSKRWRARLESSGAPIFVCRRRLPESEVMRASISPTLVSGPQKEVSFLAAAGGSAYTTKPMGAFVGRPRKVCLGSLSKQSRNVELRHGARYRVRQKSDDHRRDEADQQQQQGLRTKLPDKRRIGRVRGHR